MTSTSPANYCYKHPNRESNLRCNRCDKYICPSCAVLTPTGYRCQDCIREQKKVFDTAQIQDYVFAFVLASVLSYIGSVIVQFIGFFILFVGPLAGILIAEAVRKVVNRRRSKTLFQVVTAAVVLGGALIILDDLLLIFLGGGFGFMFNLLWPAIYIVMAASTTYVRLSGIQMSR